MFRNKVGIKGMVQAIVFDENMNIKRHPPNWHQRLFGCPGSEMISINHNLVTNIGDALIADLMQETPEKDKLNAANGKIGVGTGWTESVKTTDALVTQVGSDELIDAGPETEGAWGAANDGVIVYVATFEAGDVTSADLDEALLSNGTDTMAYAQITPAITVAAADTLEITWKITFLGA